MWLLSHILKCFVMQICCSKNFSSVRVGIGGVFSKLNLHKVKLFLIRRVAFC